MKKITFFVLISFLIGISTNVNSQGVAINDNGNPPDASAMLDVSSTTSGILIPRLTLGQRIALTPVQGLLVYQNNGVTGFYYYDGASWQMLINTGQSVFIGEGAGEVDDLSDNYNVFVGYQAGKSNTTGIHNTANGYKALYSNSIGNHNTVNGYQPINHSTIQPFNQSINQRL